MPHKPIPLNKRHRRKVCDRSPAIVAEFLTDKDVLLFLRVATSLLMPALLICQSAVPCCAISELLQNCGARGASFEQVPVPCCCCTHSRTPQEHVPPDNQDSPDSKCPYCSGLFHSALQHSGTRTDSPTVAELHGKGTKLDGCKASCLSQILHGQIFGHPCLNIGMRLLI